MNPNIVLDAIKPKASADKKWTSIVPSKEVIGCVYETSLPDGESTFVELKKQLQQWTKDLFSQKKIKGTRRKLLPPTSGSFNNCNGRWLEYIFAVYAWNAVAEVNQSSPGADPYIYVKLPNNTTTDTKKTVLPYLGPAY